MSVQKPHQHDLSRRHWLGMAAASTTVGLISQPWSFAQSPAAEGKQLIVRGELPMNAEPELKHLVDSWETPVKHFYVLCQKRCTADHSQ